MINLYLTRFTYCRYFLYLPQYLSCWYLILHHTYVRPINVALHKVVLSPRIGPHYPNHQWLTHSYSLGENEQRKFSKYGRHVSLGLHWKTIVFHCHSVEEMICLYIQVTFISRDFETWKLLKWNTKNISLRTAIIYLRKIHLQWSEKENVWGGIFWDIAIGQKIDSILGIHIDSLTTEEYGNLVN